VIKSNSVPNDTEWAFPYELQLTLRKPVKIAMKMVPSEPRMNTNSEKLLVKDEVFQIVGCAIEVLNSLGHGLVEKAIRKCISRRVLAAENSFSAATFVRPSYIKDRRLVCSFPT